MSGATPHVTPPAQRGAAHVSRQPERDERDTWHICEHIHPKYPRVNHEVALDEAQPCPTHAHQTQSSLAST